MGKLEELFDLVTEDGPWVSVQGDWDPEDGHAVFRVTWMHNGEPRRHVGEYAACEGVTKGKTPYFTTPKLAASHALYLLAKATETTNKEQSDG